MSAYSIDVETTGLRPHGKDRMFAYSVCDEEGITEIYRLDIPRLYEKALMNLQDIFDNTNIVKIFHNAKFDLSFIQKEKIKIPGNTKIHDTLIMSQLLRNLAPSHALDYLCWELCGWDRSLDKKIAIMARAMGGYQNVPRVHMDVYQTYDGQRTQLLHQTFYPEICKNPKLKSDYLNEIELIKTTMRLEQHGIMISRENCNKLIEWMQGELDIVREETHELMGEYINLNSGKQVIRLLYRLLKLPVSKMTRTGEPATDKGTLAKLREDHPHPIHELILKQRSYTKGIAIISSYMELAGKNNIIHPTINTNVAKTGRESGSNPNLQNVSKDQALLNPFPVPSRKAFRAFPGHVLYLVDYAGIEMRLIIDQAGEEELIQVISNNGDVHDLAAQVFYGEVYSDLDYLKKLKLEKKTLRSAAKNTNFAVPYGASKTKAFKTLGCEMLGIHWNTFERNFQQYCDRWPKVAFFTKDIIKIVREQNYVETPFGRRLYIPKDKMYSGANYLIQGTAAGVLKRAQVRVDKYCRRVWKDKIRIVIPIHDELILSYPRRLFEHREKILPKISKIMTTMSEIRVKLDVEWKITKTTWDQAKEIKVEY